MHARVVCECFNWFRCIYLKHTTRLEQARLSRYLVPLCLSRWVTVTFTRKARISRGTIRELFDRERERETQSPSKLPLHTCDVTCDSVYDYSSVAYSFADVCTSTPPSISKCAYIDITLHTLWNTERFVQSRVQCSSVHTHTSFGDAVYAPQVPPTTHGGRIKYKCWTHLLCEICRLSPNGLDGKSWAMCASTHPPHFWGGWGGGDGFLAHEHIIIVRAPEHAPNVRIIRQLNQY